MKVTETSVKLDDNALQHWM